jgi:hypothetical protein
MKITQLYIGRINNFSLIEWRHSKHGHETQLRRTFAHVIGKIGLDGKEYDRACTMDG